MPSVSCPLIGCDIRMFSIRPIAPAGGRRRKNTCSANGRVPYAADKESGAPYHVTSDFKRQGGRIVSIAWTVTIEPGANREFAFTAKNPSDATEIAWKAHQRYADGTSSEWVGPAWTRGPAPVTKLTP